MDQTTRARLTGRLGERLAAHYLEQRGCRVLERNLYADGGEIDLVVADGSEVVAVEVKTSTRRHQLDRVDNRKWDRVHATAGAARFVITRFDILSIVVDASGADVRWLRGAD